MMNNTDISKLVINLLNKLGVTEACLSPGARNSPIICAFSNTDFNLHSILDERSSGFYALGLSKIKKSPVLVCCTSGTALANLYPAVIEARMSETPLIIISADRPKEAIGTGENQTINQENLYGDYVKDYMSINCKDYTKKSVENKITEIVNLSLGKTEGELLSEKGPIHINLHFDEPLLSNNSKSEFKNIEIKSVNPKDADIKSLTIDKSMKKTIIVCGQSDLEDYSSIINKISNKLGAPILSDISSNIISNNNIISYYDHFINDIEAPDLIIRFGKKPLSKKLLSLLEKYRDITYLFRFRTLYNDDTLQSNLINHVKVEECEYNNSWINTFKNNDILIKDKIKLIDKESKLNEFIFSSQIAKQFPQDSNVFIGNSLIIRAFNSFSKKRFNKVKFYSNRGTSGIDGNIATSLGIASQSNQNNYLVIGDQSFMHDVGSLQILAETKQKLTIFIVNNYGGSIFNYLPNLKKIDSNSFENYILNKHSNDFKSIVKSYGLKYKKISSINDLKDIDMNETKIYEIIINDKDSIKYIRNFSTSLYSHD